MSDSPVPDADRRLRLLTGRLADADAVVSVLDGATVALTLSDAPAWHEQVLAVTLVDLLGRLFPRVVWSCEDVAAHPALPPGPVMLSDRLAEALSHGGLPPSVPGSPNLTIAVGGAVGPADVHVSASGWQSYLGPAAGVLAAGEVLCPVGPVVAACRAAAAVFERLLRAVADLPIPAFGYADALTYGAGPSPLPDTAVAAPSTVDALLVGAGSVGGACVYTLGFMPNLTGSLVVVDPQRLETHNPDRALLATAQATAAREFKVDVAARALAHHAALRVDGRPVTVGEWLVDLPPRTPLPLVLSAVDSAGARRAIQDCLPLRLVNAACGPREVTVSGHVTGAGPCVCCLHMADVLDADRVKKRMIAKETGLPQLAVVELVLRGTPLETPHLRSIELFRKLTPGSLDRYLGRTLTDLWDEQLLYGGAPVDATATTRAVVATPFVTALAGALLAAEALKHANPGRDQLLLGPNTVTQYVEDPYVGPLHAQLRPRLRWPTSECLCRSTRRARIAAETYKVPISATDPRSEPEGK